MMTNANSFEFPELQSLLVKLLARELRVDPRSIDVNRPFTQYGLDSIAAVTLVGDLEDALSIELSSTLLWDYPTVNAMAVRLRSTLNERLLMPL